MKIGIGARFEGGSSGFISVTGEECVFGGVSGGW